MHSRYIARGGVEGYNLKKPINLKRYNNGSNLPEERELVIWGRTTLHVVASGTQPFKEENHKS